MLEFLPGEEAQVDYGQGAPTRIKSGKYQRHYLFVMTLKCSGKSFRTVVWKTDQEVWAQLHEHAFRAFGGYCQYVVLDNLKEGVLRPDLYEPGLNPVYAALLSHYGVVADPCRVRDPNRKGTVESAIQHTQGTALKGRRFESLDEQHVWLAHWEERWAARRIHGRKKRQVLELYQEEQPHLRPLPLEGFRLFKPGVRTVDDAGLVQVEGSYYAALPAARHSTVTMRIYARDRDSRCRGPGAAPAREIASQGRVHDRRRGSDLQPFAREGTRARARGTDWAAHGGVRPRDVRPPGPSGNPGDLWPGEPRAHLHTRGHRSGVRAPVRCAVSLLCRRQGCARTPGRSGPRRRARAHAIGSGHSSHYRVSIVLGDARPDSPTGGHG